MAFGSFLKKMNEKTAVGIQPVRSLNGGLQKVPIYGPK